MTIILIIAAMALVLLLLIGALIYIMPRLYTARSDRTFMTHDERGFKRALRGKGVLWDPEESIVRGVGAPAIEFVGADPATGGRRNVRLLDAKTGAINLRPQFCVPRPFPAVTVEGHKVVVEARVQFSLNPDLMKHAYQIEDFGLALETRIQSAFRAEIGRRHDEELRGSLASVEAAVIEQLRRGETEGDEAGELGMALGIRFHTASFTYLEADEAADFTATGASAADGSGASAGGAQRDRVRAGFAQGVLAVNPLYLDRLADKFKDRPTEETKAVLAILEMQTRQNIAEALAASGQLIVVTPQELGLIGTAAQRDAISRSQTAAAAAQPFASNGAAQRPESRV